MEKVVISTTNAFDKDSVSPKLRGYIAIVTVLLIWTGFALSIRSIGSSPLAIADVAILRFIVPAIILLPFTHRYVAEIKRAKISDVLMILLGGVPFLFIASVGASYVPAAYVGTVLAGTPPIFISLLGFFFYLNVLTVKRVLSLSLIMLGVVVMVIGQSTSMRSELFQGVAILLSASIIWAIYTMSLKRSGLSPIAVTILISWCSLLVTCALVACGAVVTNIGTYTFNDALPFVLIQGLCVGLISTIAYSYAIRQLGSEQASIIGSLSPCLTALLAVPVFGESISIAIIGGVFLTVIGVILSNRG